MRTQFERPLSWVRLNNPKIRGYPKEQIDEMAKEFQNGGCIRPILTDLTGELHDGYLRYLAYCKLMPSSSLIPIEIAAQFCVVGYWDYGYDSYGSDVRFFKTSFDALEFMKTHGTDETPTLLFTQLEPSWWYLTKGEIIL